MKIFSLATLMGFVLYIVLSLSGSAFAGEKRVVLGQINLSFYAVAGAVVQEVLERLGHPVEVTQGSHAEMFPRLGRGEVDLLAAAWLPDAHGPLYREVADAVIDLAVLYTGARLYWSVPDYVPADLVTGIDDLKKPEVAAKMEKRIVGIGPDSGLMRGAVKINEVYGLAPLGYVVVTGPASEWVATFRRAVEEKRWIVMPLWQPHFLNQAYKVRILDEPKKIYGDGDRAVLVAHKSFSDRFPPRTVEVLKRLHLGLGAVTEMDFMVNMEKMTAREAARAWMERNRTAVDSWFAR